MGKYNEIIVIKKAVTEYGFFFLSNPNFYY